MAARGLGRPMQGLKAQGRQGEFKVIPYSPGTRDSDPTHPRTPGGSGVRGSGLSLVACVPRTVGSLPPCQGKRNCRAMAVGRELVRELGAWLCPQLGRGQWPPCMLSHIACVLAPVPSASGALKCHLRNLVIRRRG